MAENINLNVILGLQKAASTAKIQKTIREIEQTINGKPLKLNMDMSSLTKTYGTLADGTNKLVKSSFKATDALGKQHSVMYKLDQDSGKMVLASDKISSGLKNVDESAKKSAQSLGSVTKKILTWGLLTAAVYSPLRALREGVSYVMELDNAMNEVRIVTGKTQEQVEALAESYNKLGKEMSVATSEIAATSADLYRQGLADAEVEKRMKSIIEYAKISGISLEESNKIITATANATGESVNKITDIFAFLGDMTAEGADEIGESLQRVASAAENSGLSIEKTASWIATIGSITRESSSTIGRSLNSAISRFESIKKTGFNDEDSTNLNDVVKALSDIGLQALDSNGQLRNYGDVMDDVGKKWGTLSKNERAYIATTMFGTFQRNRGLTLLNNYETALENYDLALESAGQTQQKYDIYVESSQAHLDKFSTTVQGLWQHVFSSEALKNIIDFGTVLVDAIDSPMTGLVLSMASGTLAMKGLSLGWEGLIKSGKGLAIVTTVLNKAFLTSPLFVASLIGGAIYGVVQLTKHFEKQREEAYKLSGVIDVQAKSYDDLSASVENLDSEVEDSYNSVKTQKQQAESYAKTLDTLSKKTNLTAYEQEAMKLSVDGLNQIMPDLNLTIDENTGKLSSNYSQIMDNIDALYEYGMAQAYANEVMKKQQLIAEAQISMGQISAKRNALPNTTGKWYDMFSDAATNWEMNKLDKEWSEISVLVSGYEKDIELATQKIADMDLPSTKEEEEEKKKEKETKVSSSAKDSTDAWKEAFESQYDTLKYYLDKGIIDEQTFYLAVKSLNDKYFKDKAKYLEDYRDHEIEVLSGLTEFYKAQIQQQLDKQKELTQGNIDFLNDYVDDYKSALSAVDKFIDAKIKGLQEEKEAIEAANEATKEAIQLEELQDALASAKKEKNIRVYSVETGWQWQSDANAIKEAEQAISDFEVQQQLDAIDEQIAGWNKYKESWDNTVNSYQDSEDRLHASELIAEDWESAILEQRTANWQKFATDMSNLMSQINAETESLKTIEAVSASASSAGSGRTRTVTSSGNAPSDTTVGDTVITKDKKHAYMVVSHGDTSGSIKNSGYNPESNLTSVQLYDNGGWLPNGGAAVNMSGSPEPILTPQQTEAWKQGTNLLTGLISMVKPIMSGGGNISSTSDRHDLSINNMNVYSNNADNWVKRMRNIVAISGNTGV